jgi:alpha-L-fucosidase
MRSSGSGRRVRRIREAAVVVLAAGSLAAAGKPLRAADRVEPNWASIDKRPTPAWFEDAKFGVFIHWGVYSVPSFAPTKGSVYSRYSEWYWKRVSTPDMEGHKEFKAFHDRVYGPQFRYQDFAPMWKAELYDPAEWADVFQKAGAKYVVLTSKHHDGFCLWPSAQSWNWNTVDVGPHRDVAGDLVKAVRDKGLKMGFYYSLYEWFSPLYQQDPARYVDEHMLPQMKDLVTRYRPDVVWTDGEWDHPSSTWKAEEFLAWLFNESPVGATVAVNDRWGKETRAKHGGYYTTEYGLVHDKDASKEVIPHPWEECRGIGSSFGYNRAESVADYTEPGKLVWLLVDTVARGGNLLLDIGPAADGRIPVIMEERLLQLGEFLKTNGEAIYGSRRWRDTGEGDRVRYTGKGDAVYAIVQGWPGRTLTLKAPRGAGGTRVTLLGANAPVRFSQSGGGLRIDVPDSVAPGAFAYAFKLTGVR